MRTKILYVIKDPETDTPVYVGQTVNVQRRFKEHTRGTQAIDQWVRERISKGSSPTIEILSRHHKTINSAERSMIIRMSKQFNLLNQLIPIHA